MEVHTKESHENAPGRVINKIEEKMHAQTYNQTLTVLSAVKLTKPESKNSKSYVKSVD